MKRLILLLVWCVTLCAMDRRPVAGQDIVEIDTSKISSIQEAQGILTELDLFKTVPKNKLPKPMWDTVAQIRKDCSIYIQQQQLKQLIAVKKTKDQ